MAQSENVNENRFLIVDDQNLIREFLKELFSRYDIITEEAENGEEAVFKWETGNYSAILMDIQMPKMDGLQATRLIRKREKEEKRNYTPIIALSGVATSDPEKDCTSAGMDGFLAKPVFISQLLDVVLPYVK
ncbi:MAG: response regulator [Desulfobulbaceae bacterium]|nr:response regulator [Desulfobulbaceae bacterium]